VVVGEDIAGLDRSYARLVRFLRGCGDPTARALAASRFLTVFPPDYFLGRSFYLEDIGPRLLADVRLDPLYLSDPEVASAICEGLRALGPAGLAAASEVLAASLETPARPSPPHNTSAGDWNPDQVVAALVPIPVCLEPPPPAPGVAALGLGKLVTLIIRPRPADTGEPCVRWPSQPDLPDDPRLRSLHKVAHDALAAARQAVPHAARPGFDLDFTESEAPVAGDSAGLGMAAAMAGVLVATVSGRFSSTFPARAGRGPHPGPRNVPHPGSDLRSLARRRLGLRPRPDLAWTGAIHPDGTVGPVDAGTLRAKTRAAYYGGMAGMVVPWEQVQTARLEIPSEADGVAPASQAPAVGSRGVPRRFEIHGVASLRVALETPDLFEPWVIPAMALRTPWHRRRVTPRWITAGVLVGVLALSTSLLLPEVVGRTGPHVSMNPRGDLVRVTFDGGARALQFHPDRTAAFAAIAPRLPGDPSGQERLVILTSRSDSSPAELSIHELRRGRVVWKYIFTSSGLPLDLRAAHPEGVYNGKAGVIGDLDGDGDNEIVVVLSVHPYADCVLRLFDDQPIPTGALYHRGHIEGLVVSDLDRDGKGEVVATGLHAASSGVSALFLRQSDFRAEADSTHPWDPGAQPCMAHFVFPRPPRLKEDLGVLELGADPLPQIALDRDGSPSVGLFTFIQNPDREPLRPGYFIYLSGSPPGITTVTADANLGQASQNWIRDGRGLTDFSSSAFVAEWRRSFRVFDHIDIDTPPAGSPL
jgi:hypothetical protein